ncbi:MAG: hypothetical protein DI582_08265 [Azospirillum brasilense]|nr:MAG: hypothetical protein DI582_08265 [Azospirillum brasilense]
MDHGTDLTRRRFLLGMGALSCCSVLGLPRLAFASAPTEKRLMVVILRGAMDGLGAIAPIKDANYHAIRSKLALPETALLPLDGYFAMHRALQPIHALYGSKELLVLHAVSTPYRDRSHFDAQDLLENGSPRPHGLNTGWLGRTLQAMAGTKGLAVGPSVPLIMQGSKQVQSWAPSMLPETDADFLSRVSYMYAADPMFGDALKEAGGMADMAKGNAVRGQRQFIDLMKNAATFMVKPDGARLATIDLTGWDTHAGQGTDNGRLPQALGVLAEGLSAFRSGMGAAWKDTAVLVVTEFGRTVRMNGTGGTDHGTGSVAFLLGGTVRGGQIIGEWPTLAENALYEGRDLYPANDMRSLQKAVLQQHLGLSADVVESAIFPDSRSSAAYPGLFANA